MLHRMIRQIKVSSDRFRCVFVVFLYASKVGSEVGRGGGGGEGGGVRQAAMHGTFKIHG